MKLILRLHNQEGDIMTKLLNFRKSFFFKIFLYYISFFVCILVITVFLNRYYTNLLEDEAVYDCRNALVNISERVSVMMDEIYQTNRLLILDENLYNIILNDAKIKTEDYYKLVDTVNSLIKLRATKNIFEIAYIFSKNSNLIISSDGTVSADFFYNKYYVYGEYDFDYWSNMSLKSVEYKILNTTKVKVNRTQSEKFIIPFVQSQIGDSKFNNLFVINIDEAEVRKVLGRYSLSKNSIIFISDKYGNIMSSTNMQKTPQIIKDETFFEKLTNSDDKYFIYNFEGNPLLVSVHLSNIMNKQFIYTACIPLSEIFDKSIKIRNAVYLISLFTFLLLCIISFFISKKLYRPLKNLMAIMKDYQVEQNTADGLNEYDFLSNEILKLINGSKSLAQSLTYALPLAREQYLLKILNHNETEIDEFGQRKLVSSFKIDFEHQYFCVALIEFSFSEKIKTNYDDHEKQVLINNSIIEIMKNLILAHYDVHPITIGNNRLCIIINLEKEDCIKSLEGSIREIYGKFCKEGQSILVYIGIGQVKYGIDNVYFSYKEALKALTFLSPFSKDKIKVFDTELKQSQKACIFPIDDENKLYNYLIGGYKRETDELLKDLINRNINGEISDLYLKDLYMQIYMIGQRALIYRNMSPEELMGEEFINFTSEFDNISPVEIINYINRFFISIASLADENTISKLDLEGIKNYIDKNYNSEIYLVQLADRYNTAVPYLSKVLREFLGMNFQQYLAKIRISNAKKLLSESSMPINNIMEAVGFNSRNTFIRMFKKFEGITPSEYRNLSNKPYNRGKP